MTPVVLPYSSVQALLFGIVPSDAGVDVKSESVGRLSSDGATEAVDADAATGRCAAAPPPPWESPDVSVRRAAARDPLETPPPALARLAQDGNFWVRRDAAKNPKTPAQELHLLRRAGSGPGLTGFAEVSEDLAASEFARLAAGGEWARCLAGRHPGTTAALLAQLAGDLSPTVRKMVAGNFSAPATALGRLATDADADVRAEASGNSNTPTRLLRMLRRAGSEEDLSGLSDADLTLRPVALAELAKLGQWARRLAARHPNTPTRVLRKLADDPDWDVRHAVAGNPDTDKASLYRLAGSDSAAVREAVARNPAASPEAIARLLECDEQQCPLVDSATDRNDDRSCDAARSGVRSVAIHLAVARHAHAPPELLRRLAEDANPVLREAVARNPRTPPETLRLLVRAGSSPDLLRVGDSDSLIDVESLERLSRGGMWARFLAARHRATPAACLARLAEDADVRVRQEVARHPETPKPLLDLLRRAGGGMDLGGFETPDPSLRVDELEQLAAGGPWARRLVARHSRTPAAILRRLARDTDVEVRRLVATNPAADAAALLDLSHDASHGVRWRVGQHPCIPAEALSRFATDPALDLRLLAARHPRTPASVLATLACDAAADVRAAVRLSHPGSSAPLPISPDPV